MTSVHVERFDPCGSWTWYLTEFSPVVPDGVPHLGFGLVDGHEAELDRKAEAAAELSAA